MRIAQCLGLVLLLGGPSVAQTQFTEVTAAAGIDYIQGYQLGNHESMTGGAAARDYDGDGWTDLLVTRFPR